MKRTRSCRRSLFPLLFSSSACFGQAAIRVRCFGQAAVRLRRTRQAAGRNAGFRAWRASGPYSPLRACKAASASAIWDELRRCMKKKAMKQMAMAMAGTMKVMNVMPWTMVPVTTSTVLL